ncbi:MAG: hypothetical protein HRT77_07345 [Halioglobus sp.]|nr:hypothetical protein [Halioglobus sp.]
MTAVEQIGRSSAWRLTAGRRGLPRKKILIVNAYFPDERQPVKRSHQVPNTVAPVLLAGYFHADLCDIKLYNEVSSGYLEVYQPDLLSWPDMLVITGLSAAFDRLLHLTAYARSANSSVIVAAGGHGVRSLPKYAEQFFDYTCLQDVEQIGSVIADAFGPCYLSERFNPRYDLAYWIGKLGYAESTRNCNFNCGFCSLTGAGRKYEVAPDKYLEAQLENMGKRLILFFDDNQVFGATREDFERRISQVQRRRAAGQFKYWSGFVTDTFFWDDNNIKFASDTGCISVFVGVESFDDHSWLASSNKKQNSRFSQKELLRRAIDGGILVQYGLVFDPTKQTVAQMYRELDIICADPEIPAPNFIFTATPYPGTPFFHECARKGLILPNTHVRDLEGSTLCLKPIDSMEDAVDFVRDGRRLARYRGRLIKHQLRFNRRYRQSLNFHQRMLSNITAAAILAPTTVLGPGELLRRKLPRTHVSTTELLDDIYRPRRHVDRRYRHYFEPTAVTDYGGELNLFLVDDLLAQARRHEPGSTFLITSDA